jgi:hypothetical protein
MGAIRREGYMVSDRTQARAFFASHAARDSCLSRDWVVGANPRVTPGAARILPSPYSVMSSIGHDIARTIAG